MIFVPLLHYFKCKNTYSGNEYGLRYRLTPGKRSVPDPEGGEGAVKEESILTVDYWPDPWTLEMTDPALRRQEIFPLTDEGRAAAAELSGGRLQRRPGTLEELPRHDGLRPLDAARTGTRRRSRDEERMIYRLKELQGDTIAVPQLVFSKLGIAEEYNVRVALYVLATGITDPDKICADLKLRSRISAESALSFWAGAGLLERYEENAAPGAEPSAPAPMTWAEIAAASRTDPMISSLIDCAQTGFARPLTHREMEKLVNLYVQEGFAPETVMLCVAYVASCGKRTMAAVVHELKVWRTEGVETGEQADAHLKLLALRRSREQYVSGLLGISTDELTLGGRKAIARWYEVYGYDDAMVQEAAVQAGPKRDLWYWNSILKTWNAKGLRTIHDVRGPVADAGASRNIRVDREAPSGNDFLGSSSLSASLNRLKKRSNT